MSGGRDPSSKLLLVASGVAFASVSGRDSDDVSSRAEMKLLLVVCVT